MAWIRLSDDYNDHPKFFHLSDGAFRLWHQAMGFCRKHKTDGLIPTTALRTLRAFTAKRMTELLTPWSPGENALWQAVDGFGVKVHDYLEWNPSRDEENARRDDSKDRMRALRAGRRSHSVMPSVSANTPRTFANVLDQEKDLDRALTEKESEEKPDKLELRAGRLRQELYPEWYAKYRHGARLRLIANSLEFQDAMSLVQVWDDARLEKLAKIVLTTDDPWIANTDRGFKIFALKASWADDRLKVWEAERGIA